MRILHLTPLYWPSLGGGEVHVKEVSEGLAARGHQVTILTTNIRTSWDIGEGIHGGLPAVEVLNGVRIVRFRPDGALLGRGFRRWERLRGATRAARRIFGADGFELLRQNPATLQLIPYLAFARSDIVTSAIWLYPVGYHAYLARRLRRFRLVGMPLFHTAQPWAGRPVYRRMLASCDAVVTNTGHEAAFVRSRADVRVEVGGVGVHPVAFARRDGQVIRTRYGIGDAPVIGFVGRQAPEKGLLQVIRAMPTVWASHPQARLIIAGPRSPRENAVDAALAALSVVERHRVVRIDDFADADKASLYDAFDVFALPSVEESFGITYLEAWMCGKPVIGARIDAVTDVIDDGVDGLLVDPIDAQSLARAILELLADPAKRRRMGQRGETKTRARYTWDQVTDRFERLYVELLADHATPRPCSAER
jgi:glycosyltransferase involved in cell wall biosynthesis